jgi:hypothetical protein
VGAELKTTAAAPPLAGWGAAVGIVGHAAPTRQSARPHVDDEGRARSHIYMPGLRVSGLPVSGSLHGLKHFGALRSPLRQCAWRWPWREHTGSCPDHGRQVLQDPGPWTREARGYEVHPSPGPQVDRTGARTFPLGNGPHAEQHGQEAAVVRDPASDVEALVRRADLVHCHHGAAQNLPHRHSGERPLLARLPAATPHPRCKQCIFPDAIFALNAGKLQHWGGREHPGGLPRMLGGDLAGHPDTKPEINGLARRRP